MYFITLFLFLSWTFVIKSLVGHQNKQSGWASVKCQQALCSSLEFRESHKERIKTISCSLPDQPKWAQKFWPAKLNQLELDLIEFLDARFEFQCEAGKWSLATSMLSFTWPSLSSARCCWQRWICYSEGNNRNRLNDWACKSNRIESRASFNRVF